MSTHPGDLSGTYNRFVSQPNTEPLTNAQAMAATSRVSQGPSSPFRTNVILLSLTFCTGVPGSLVGPGHSFFAARGMEVWVFNLCDEGHVCQEECHAPAELFA